MRPCHRIAAFFPIFYALLVCTCSPGESPKLIVGPFLQLDPGGSITAIVETDRSCSARLLWGRDGALDHTVKSSEPSGLHRLTMTGFEPGMRYGYVVEYGGKRTDTAEFSTPPTGPDSRWRLAIYSDTQGHPENHEAIVRAIMAEAPNLVLHLGDFTDDGRRHELWDSEFFTPAQPLGRSVPYIPVSGNHEYGSGWFYRYFGIDYTAGAWYSLDIGDTHLTVLNSDFDHAAWDQNSEQARWLVDDLSRNAGARWKIAAFHHPLFSSRNSRPIAPQRWFWHQLLESGGVDMAFNAHEHNYFRTAAIGTMDTLYHRRGLIYVIDGSGGGDTKNVDPQDYGLKAVEQMGFVTVDFSAERLICRALNESGEVMDSFTVEHRHEPEADQFASFIAELFERQLTEAIYKSKPIELSGGGLNGRVELHFPAFFNAPLRAGLEWELPPGWRVTRSSFTNPLEPRSEMKFEFEVSAHPVELGLGPAAVLTLSRPDSRRAFVNDRIVFHPFKIKRTDPLIAGKLDKPPVLDGVVDENEWSGTPLLENFNPSVREYPIGKIPFRTSVRLGYIGDTLYLGGFFLGEPSPSRGAFRDRDSERTLEDETFAVSFGCADSSYTLILSSASSVLDTRNGNPAWNMAFEQVITLTDRSWSVELAIPMDQFPEGPPDRINLYRQDYFGLVCDEWNPSYRPLGRTYSVIPAYGISYTNLATMVELKYE